MYFDKIQPIPYPFGDDFKVVRDITLNIRFRQDILDNISLYNEYDIENDDTPEIIAEKLYKDPNLYWIIMLYNQRYHYILDFPLNENDLSDYIQQKYGSGKAYDQKHLFGCLLFVDGVGRVVDEDAPGATPVTNFDYEFNLNEKKRRIRVIDPRLVDQIVNEFESLMSNG